MLPGARSAKHVLALSALLATPAAGAWTYVGSVTVEAPCPAAPTSLVVVREATEVDCAASDGAHLRCAFRTRLVVRNPTDETAHALLRAARDDDSLTFDERSDAAGAELVVAPHAERALTARGVRSEELRGDSDLFRGFGEGALGLMHPLMVEAHDRTRRVLVTAQRARSCRDQGRGWASEGALTLVTHAPRRWLPTIGWEQHGLCQTTDRGVDCLQVEELDVSSVSMSYDVSRPGPLRAGGLTLGLGATTPHGPRARLGYEFGIGRRFVGAASIEGDLAGNVVVTPTLGYAFPLFSVGWWRDAWLPGAIVGWVGAPVGLLPDRRVGARAQASLVWIFAGLDAAVDWWPVDGRVDVSVMLRVGL